MYEESYLIKITDHINKSDRIIYRLTTLESCNKDLHTVVDTLNKDNKYLSTISNGHAELTLNEQVVVPGYFYNSTKTVTTLAYTLSLIKIDDKLSNLFLDTRDADTQTNSNTTPSDLQTKETQSESTTKNASSQVYDVSQLTQQYEDTKFYDDDQEEFGEFQSYTPEFVNVDLNNNNPFCYDRSNDRSHVIIPDYPNTTFNSYNPFNNIMSLRGENEDVHFTFGSRVPKTPTQVVTNWAPELVSELKFRLAQPNAGLTPINGTSYFL